MRLALFGIGGFGREILRPARTQVNDRFGPYDEIVFVDDNAREPFDGVPVLSVDQLRPDDCFVIAVGSSQTRRQISRKFPDLRAGGIIARSAIIGPEVQIGEGAIFCDFTIVTASARIGSHFHCNIYSYVAHDCVIGDFVTFAPKVACNGNVVIEDDVYVGTGAVIKQGETGKPTIIGRGSVIGMGAVVTKSVQPGSIVVGNPAKPLEKRKV